MIYLDTSVALAHLLAEDRAPPESLWAEALVSSRLLEYELWTRLNALRLAASHGEAARQLCAGLAFLELVRPVLSRALDPFPVAVRTLDGLHLASMEFLREQGQMVALASYDERLSGAARAMGFDVVTL